MPFVRISLLEGKDPAYQSNIVESVYNAMLETFNVPEDDKFMVIHEHKRGQLNYGETYLDIKRTDDLIIIQITCNNTRNLAQKKALYAAIVSGLVSKISIRPEDVFISLVEVPRENWSFGNGEAQYADDQ